MNKRSNFKIALLLIKELGSLIKIMFLAIFVGVVGHLLAAFVPILGSYSVLSIIGIGDYSLKIVLTVLVIFASFRGVFHYIEQYCNHYIAFTILAIFRDKVFDKLRKLCPAKLECKDRGNLITLITSDIELLEVFYAHTISPIAIAFLMTLVMSIFIALNNIYLGIWALFSYIVVGIFIPMYINKISENDGKEYREKSGDLSSFVLGRLYGLSEVIQYSYGDTVIHELNEKTKSLLNVDMRMKHTMGKTQAITNSLILALDVIMIVIGAVLYTNNLITFQEAFISIISLMSSFGPVIALSNLGSGLQNTFAAGDRVLDLLEEEPITEEVVGRKDVIFNGANMIDVTFGYGKEIILDNFNATIKKDSIIGIVGRSGSGKSTILKLLMRFWGINKGEINILDKDSKYANINDINSESLRRNESYMCQTTHLFNDTIKENLLIANRNATDKDIIKACKKASIHEFIDSLPHGYDTNISELGENLSGGERQRISLARAFLHDSPFILLDEPTSNLDSLNEAIILKSIKEQIQDKTVILVTHRQSTIGIADEIIKIDG